MTEAPPLQPAFQQEQERQDALKRTDALLRLKERLERGTLPDRREIVALLNSANVEIDEVKTDPRISPLGQQILDHVSDLLDAVKAFIKKPEGLAGSLVDLSCQTVLALQESATELGRTVSETSPQVSKAAQQVGQSLESKTEGAATRARGVAERLLSVLRQLATSPEGRRLSAELATLIRRVLQITGETVEKVAKQTKDMGGEEREPREKRRVSEAESGAGAVPMHAIGTEHDHAAPALPSAEQVQDAKKMLGEGKEQLKRETEEHVETIQQLARRLLRRAVDHEELRGALRELLDMFRDVLQTVQKTVEQVATQNTSQVQAHAPGAPRARSHAEQAAQAAEDVLRHIVGSDSIDDLKGKFNQLHEGVQKDQEFNDLFKDLTNTLHDALENPRLIEDDDRFNKLFDNGSKLFGEKENKVAKVASEIASQIKSMVNDVVSNEHVKDLQNSVNKLRDDLIAQDKFQLKDEALLQLKLIVAPALARRLRLLALPPIMHNDENYDMRLDELVLYTPDIPPEKLQAHLESDLSLDLRTMTTSSIKSKLVITMRNLMINAPNFRFRFEKKGFPKLHDEGHADLEAKSVDLVLEFEQQAKQPYLSHAKAKCNVADFSITVKNDADHRVMLQWYTSFYKDRMGSALAEAIASSLKSLGETLISVVNRVFELLTSLAAPAGSMVGAVAGYSASSRDDKQQQQQPSSPAS